MLVQLTPHAPYTAAAAAWTAQTTSRSAEQEEASHVIRLVGDSFAVSFVVRRRAGAGAGDAADLLVLKSPAAPAADDQLAVFLASAPLHECLEGIRREVGPEAIEITAPGLTRDPLIAGLGRALAARRNTGAGLDALYANAVSVALLTRLVGLCRAHGLPAPRPRSKSALPKWRLKRVVAHVDTHLDGCISLADMAAAAGLTRMHFAAQFRLATGMRPHEYVLRRRIDRAQEMLRQSDLALVDVALSVGFQTQAHFTTVFKRFAGETPHRWRQATFDGPTAALM